ncbi:MAG: tRNA uridine-5-carboxymethylaminomethyl(34) synthesis GTPase MnmE [Clostridia bacterium]|nr:tRNA uridine-5-carboxymethylaminomethyl(34) synthesis GTPase MnmE [Clostridia bacterium]
MSTPPGKGGVALIRLSGEEAFDIAGRVFVPKNKKPFADLPLRMQVYGDIYLGKDRIDDGMMTKFKAPYSYTGEDTVEFTCHGGMLITKLVLESLFTAGAVPAAPGEYTRRAFMNGKLGLTEAEAIGTLLDAKSFDQVKLTSTEGRSRLSAALAEVRSDLLSVMSSIYARIDYPDEDLGEFSDDDAARILIAEKEKIEKLIRSYRTGKAVTEGIPTVICGKPNVGKSSLYNLLLGENAAIVTDTPGTTRDVLSGTVSLGRVMLDLFDTAGIRETDDPIEKIGVSRSRDAMEKATLILAVFDTSRPLDAEDLEIIGAVKRQNAEAIAVLNKTDLPTKIDVGEIRKYFANVVSLSALKEDTGELSAAVNRLFTDEKLVIGQDAVIFSARQNAALMKARDCIATAIEAYADGFAADAASSDVELALGAIGEIDGKAVCDEVVNDIFSKFCVGK